MAKLNNSILTHGVSFPYRNRRLGIARIRRLQLIASPTFGYSSMARTWYALHEYETLDITSRAYQARHHRRPSADQVRQITSNFIQGREYFLSSTSAARAVRPLLQYYGVLALARGLILFLNPTAREANLVQGHGLGAHEWVSTLQGGIRKIVDLRVKLQKGIFHELLNATIDLKQRTPDNLGL